MKVEFANEYGTDNVNVYDGNSRYLGLIYQRPNGQWVITADLQYDTGIRNRFWTDLDAVKSDIAECFEGK